MKKVIALILVLVMAVGLMAGCGDNSTGDAGAASGKFGGKDLNTDSVKIAYIPVGTAGANIKISEMARDDVLISYPNGNIEINFFDAAYDPTKQITIVNDCVAQGYDGIVIECADEVALTAPLEAAEQAGVVVCVTNMGCNGLTSMYLNSYSYDAGWAVGEMMVEKMGTSGNVVLLDCPAAMVATTLHGKGFQDYIAQYPDIKLIDYANIDGFSQETANTVFRDMLTKHDKIDAVYAMADDMAMGVAAAIETAGREGDGILVYGSEGMPYTCEAIKEGRITGTVWADRYTFCTTAFVSTLLYINMGINTVNLGLETTPWVKFPFQKIDESNVDDMIPLLRYGMIKD